MRRILEIITASVLLVLLMPVGVIWASDQLDAGADKAKKPTKALYIPLYRGAQVSDQTHVENTDWELPLAKYQKINGIWQFSASEFLQGDLEKTTYLLQTRDLYNNIATFYQTWSRQSHIEVLYACKNRSCGSSNEWANGYFKISKLYGIDGKQRYWALKSGDEYLSLYLIERSNRQKLLHIERLTPRS